LVSQSRDRQLRDPIFRTPHAVRSARPTGDRQRGCRAADRARGESARCGRVHDSARTYRADRHRCRPGETGATRGRRPRLIRAANPRPLRRLPGNPSSPGTLGARPRPGFDAFTRPWTVLRLRPRPRRNRVHRQLLCRLRRNATQLADALHAVIMGATWWSSPRHFPDKRSDYRENGNAAPRA